MFRMLFEFCVKQEILWKCVGGCAETKLMGALPSVAEVLRQSSVFLEISSCRASDEKRPVALLVSKSIAFDSGGLCLEEPHAVGGGILQELFV